MLSRERVIGFVQTSLGFEDCLRWMPVDAEKPPMNLHFCPLLNRSTPTKTLTVQALFVARLMRPVAIHLHAPHASENSLSAHMTLLLCFSGGISFLSCTALHLLSPTWDQRGQGNVEPPGRVATHGQVNLLNTPKSLLRSLQKCQVCNQALKS